MARYIDLTFPIHEGMLTTPAPWHPIVEVTILGRHEFEGRATRKVVLGSHTGTHVDAPYHFVPDGKTIDQVPVDTLINRAVVIDVSDKPEYGKTTAQDLQDSGVQIPQGCSVIIHTGWYKNWMKKDYYFKWPHLTMDACEYLGDKRPKLVALDTPSPDDPKDKIAFGEISPHHYYFLSKGIVLVEFLANLNDLTKTEVQLIALPLKVQGADGFPARVIAVEQE